MSEMQPDDLQPDALESLKNLIAKGLVRYRWYWKLRWRKALELVVEKKCTDFRQLRDASPHPITMAQWDCFKRPPPFTWYKYSHIAACALREHTGTVSMIVHADNAKEIQRGIRVIEMIAGLGFLQHEHMGFLELSIEGHTHTWAVCLRCERQIETSKSFECAYCNNILCENCCGPGDFMLSDHGWLCRGECEEVYQF
jgi:hypothetical protein